MTKRSFIFSSALVFAFSLLLTACEGFFTNNDLDEKIRAAIDYAHAPVSVFTVSADSSAGTIIPSGQVNYKPTDYQNIEFTCNSNYEFLYWEFSYKQTSQAADTPTLTAVDEDWWKEYITIVNEERKESVKDSQIVYTYFLQIQFNKAVDNLLISPKCGKKPMVESLFPDAPTAARSQSRDNDINITFDSVLDPESIKNSIIIKDDGIDCTANFAAPVLVNTGDGANKKSIIIISPIDSLDCPDGGTAKITIELSSNIKTAEGVALTAQTLFYYINDISSVSCFVDLGGTYEGGSMSPNTSPLEYGLNKVQTLKFNESTGYQFLHWECNNDKINFRSQVSDNPILFSSSEEVPRSELAKIEPVYIARPVFKEAIYSVENVTVQPRDTNITLVFDNVPAGASLVIPDDAVFAIDCVGKGSVITSFKAPEVDSNNPNKIKITAYKDSRRIQVTEETEVSITIPDSIYYVYHDDVTDKDVNVTLGKSVKVSYSIGNTTSDKAYVTFSRKNGQNSVGNLFYNNAKMTAEEKEEEYNIDKTVSLKFEPDSNYEFLYWNIEGDDNVEIDDKFSTQTTITVNGAGDVSIYPKCEPKITAVLEIPDEYYSDTKHGYYSNSDIWIKTNIKPQAFDLAAQNGNSYNCITVTFNGNNVTFSNYELPQIIEKPNGDTYIKLASKNKLPVPAGTNAPMAVSVRIDGTLYYNSDDSVIEDYLGNKKQIKIANNGANLTFNVIEDTKQKFYVKFEELEGITADASALSRYKASDWADTKLYVLNESSSFDLLYSLQDTHQFIDWNIKGIVNNADVAVDESVANIETTTLQGSKNYSLSLYNITENCVGSSTDNPIIITPVCVPKLNIESYTPVTTGTGAPASVARDSDITITFNVAPPATIKNWISITCDGVNASKYFDIKNATISGNTLTIKPSTNGKISVPSGTTRTVQVTIGGKASYTYTLNGSSYNIPYIGEPFEYVINETTIKKANIQFRIKDASTDEYYEADEAGVIQLNEKAVPVTENTPEVLNVDGLTNAINYIANENFKFVEWTITNHNTYSSFDTTAQNTFIKLLDKDDLLEITLYVKKKLVVTDFSPKNISSGVSYDTPITLTYNWDIYNDFIRDGNTFTQNGIDILIGSTRPANLDVYFERPAYDQTTHTITIKSKCKPNNFDQYFTKDTLPITVSIASASSIYVEESPFTYTVFKGGETNPPEFQDFAVIPNRNNNMTKCILNEYQNYAKGIDAVSNVRKNIAYKLYFDGKAIDSDSGISKITIKEQLIYSVTGEKISTGQIYSNVVYQNWGTTKPKSTELKRIPGYSFYSPDDGVVRITMVITDAYGNECSTSFDVVKDTLVTPVNLKAAASFKSSSAHEGYNHEFEFTPKEYYFKNKHLLYATETSELVATTLNGKKLTKNNIYATETEQNGEKTINYLSITDISVKHGYFGEYQSIQDMYNTTTNYTNNNGSWKLDENGDFYSKVLKIYSSDVSKQEQRTLFIQPTMDEDIYVKYTTKDSNDNTVENVYVIPHIIKVSSVTEVAYNNSSYKKFRVKFAESATPENSVDIRCYYLIGNQYFDEWVGSTRYYQDNGTYRDVTILNSKLENAEFNSISFNLSGNRNYFYNHYDYIYRINSSTPTQTCTEEDLITERDRTEYGLTATFPTLENYSVTKGPANSNCYFISVEFGDTSHNYAFNQDYNHIKTYMLLTDNDNPSEQLKVEIPRTIGEIMPYEYNMEQDQFRFTPLQNFTFTVPSGKKYKLCILLEIGTNAAGKTWKSTEHLIDCSYDNIAPQIASPSVISYGSSVVLSTTDTNATKLITEDNLLYYNEKPYLYYSYTDSSLTENYFDMSDTKRMLTFEQNAKRISFPFYVENAKYLNVKIYDAYGNSCYKSLPISSFIRLYDVWENQTDIEVDYIKINDSDQYESLILYPGMTYEGNGDDYTPMIVRFYEFKNDKGYWYEPALDKTIKAGWDFDNDLIFTNSPIKTSYLKILTAYASNSAMSFSPYYYYPAYASGNITCNVKKLIDLNGVMTLTCDQPTFIHTLFSSNNYGTDITLWECLAGEVNAKVVSSTINYNPDSISINEGDYYIVVVYFADGTRQISKVYQK